MSITLFATISPNRHKFVYFKSDDNYFAYLKSRTLYRTISDDNARLMNNSIILSQDTTTTFSLTLLTYIREDRGAGFIRYYFVDNYQYFGDGKYQFTLTPDNWANFIAKAQFEHIILERCNRFPMALKYAKYDEINNVIEYNTDNSINNAYMNYTPLSSISIDDVYIVFSLVYLTYKDARLFADTVTVSDTTVFCVGVKELIKDIPDAPEQPPMRYIEKAIQTIGGIYATNNELGNEYDAYVNNIYLLPKSFIPNTITTNFEIKTAFTANLRTGTMISSNVGLKIVYNSFNAIKYSIPITPDTVTYFGTKSAMLKLHRVFNKSNNITANIECIVKKDSVQIIARCGDDQLDITQSFSIGIPNTTGATTSLEMIQRALSTVGSLSGAVAQGVKGEYIGAGITAFKAGLGVIQDSLPNAQYKNNGDGLTTWTATKNNNEWWNIDYPICYTKYKSACDEVAKVKELGAIFSQFVTSIDELFDGSPIVDGIEQNTVYVKASLEVVKIPTESANFIQNQFNNGIIMVEV